MLLLRWIKRRSSLLVTVMASVDSYNTSSSSPPSIALIKHTLAAYKHHHSNIPFGSSRGSELLPVFRAAYSKTTGKKILWFCSKKSAFLNWNGQRSHGVRVLKLGVVKVIEKIYSFSFMHTAVTLPQGNMYVNAELWGRLWPKPPENRSPMPLKFGPTFQIWFNSKSRLWPKPPENGSRCP